MHYLGGKATIAKWVTTYAMSVADSRSRYLEPFLGSCAVFRSLSQHFAHLTATDANPDLILMWQAVRGGWKPPFVSLAQYNALKADPIPSALRGFAGFACSFGGKWFGGYTHPINHGKSDGSVRDHISEAQRSVASLRPYLADVNDLRQADYRDHSPDKRTFVYCDPPYAGTETYKGVAPFNSDEFWETATKWSERGATVVVSEVSAPKGWRVLAERSSHARLQLAEKHATAKRSLRVERLFVRG